ncbi:Imm10 family immunity protein [Xanthomonas bundabergensis]|uniref:Imm10 family immunity protein n=1 Tax=Xanthomonas bundabergensis TaxID=3160842 RepID=UPI003513DB82
MTSFALEAKSVAVAHPEGEFHLVGFANHESDVECYFMLQRALEFDEQEVSLGMDTYHVEWCGQENSGYGGISRFLLFRDHAEITFAPGGAGALGGLELLGISFELTPSEYSALLEALADIFEGSGCLVVADAQ